MKFFFDENFPRAAAELLGARGHEWADIRGTDQEGSEDTTIFRMAQEQGAVFLTTDRDFFHTVPHLEKSHHGVVVVALRQPDRQSILRRLEWFLDHFGDADLGNKVFELRDRTYVVFPSPAVGPSDASEMRPTIASRMGSEAGEPPQWDKMATGKASVADATHGDRKNDA